MLIKLFKKFLWVLQLNFHFLRNVIFLAIIVVSSLPLESTNTEEVISTGNRVPIFLINDNSPKKKYLFCFSYSQSFNQLWGFVSTIPLLPSLQNSLLHCGQAFYRRHCWLSISIHPVMWSIIASKLLSKNVPVYFSHFLLTWIQVFSALLYPE